MALLDWSAAALLDSEIVQATPQDLRDMIRALVENQPTAQRKLRLALHMATVYRGTIDNDTSAGPLRRTFCALPHIDDDAGLAESAHGLAFLSLRDS